MLMHPANGALAYKLPIMTALTAEDGAGWLSGFLSAEHAKENITIEGLAFSRASTGILYRPIIQIQACYLS